MRTSADKKLKKSKVVVKKMRSVVMMTLLCIMLLSTATYAWFTLSDTARVLNLTLTIGGESGLLIAPAASANSPGTYKSVLSFGADSTDYDGSAGGARYQIGGKLLPATTSDGRTFRKPVYAATDGSVVTGLENLSGGDRLTSASGRDAEGYYYETVFWLKAVSSGDLQVTLAGKNGDDGTFVTVEDSLLADGAAAVRISLSTPSQTLVYEPHADVSGTGKGYSSATDNSRASVVTDTMKQNSNGVFTNRKSLTVSNAGTMVTMRIWIEGTDDMCVNEIMAEQIKAQLQFEIIE